MSKRLKSVVAGTVLLMAVGAYAATVGNTPPAASNGTASYSEGVTRVTLYFYTLVSDPEQSYSQMTYELVSAPSHGSLEYYDGGYKPWTPGVSTPVGRYYCYYSPDPGFVGSDSFTWKCNDGSDDSNVASYTVTINAVPPAPKDSLVAAGLDTPLEIEADYTGGARFSCTAQVRSGPSHGSIATSGTTFTYTPDAGFEGPDSFNWRIIYEPLPGLEIPGGYTAEVTCSVFVMADSGKDWPQFRANAYRNAITTHELPATLKLQWVRELPTSVPGWTGSRRYYYTIDNGYEPVVEGKTLFVGSNRNDCVMAFDTVSGAEKWRFYTGGPVRVAPVVTGGRVFVPSDDGYLYTLAASDGTLIKKTLGGPSERKCFGNSRLISAWPLRGGPMLDGGKVSFTAGLWPLEGVFMRALDAGTSNEVWENDTLGSLARALPHAPAGSTVCGIVPQGYLVRSSLASDRFFVPASRCLPAEFKLDSGDLIRWATAKKTGGWAVRPDGTVSTSYPTTITAGSKTYTSSTAGSLGVSGTVHSMIAADDRLFVVTRSTPPKIWCFGGASVTPKTWSHSETPLPSTNDAWTMRVASVLATSGVDSTKGFAMVWGIGTGRAVEELVKQSNLHVVAVDPSASKVAALRAKLVNAGLYGTRASVLEADPMTIELPPYLARLVVVEDVSAAGFASGAAFAEGLFHVLRPYGGGAWLLTSSAQHTSFSGWAASAGLSNGSVARDGEFSVLTRAGKLAGAIEYTRAYGTITESDALVKVPFSVSWYSDIPGQFYDGGHYGT